MAKQEQKDEPGFYGVKPRRGGYMFYGDNSITKLVEKYSTSPEVAKEVLDGIIAFNDSLPVTAGGEIENRRFRLQLGGNGYPGIFHFGIQMTNRSRTVKYFNVRINEAGLITNVEPT